MNKSKLTNGVIFSVIKHNAGIIAVLLLMGVLLSIGTPFFLTSSNLISLFRQISNNLYIALGMTFVIILGGIDLSVGSLVAMCGVITVANIVNTGLPIGAAIAIGLFLGAFAGFISGVLIAQFRVPAFIITMAMMNIARGIAYLYTGARSTRIFVESFNAIGSGYVGIVPLPIIYSVIFVIIFSILLNRTKFGTYIYAVGGNRESAHLSGVPIKKVEIACYTISGFMSAFAGLVLCARMFSGQPSIGEGYELDAIAACVLGGISMSGGVGKISGTVFGAITIGMISNGLNLMNVSSYWQLVAKGFIIVVAILIDAQKNNNKMRIMMQRRAEALKQEEAAQARKAAEE